MYKFSVNYLSVNIVFILLFSLKILVVCNRVLELNDKFLELCSSDKRAWLVKFYAPWCHHCRNLEPIWAQVAQHLHSTENGLYVGRVDCTKYTNVASHFSVKGFPTIMFIGADKRIEFRGDRTKEELIDFALRMFGPPIRTIVNCNDIEKLQEKHSVFFGYIGNDTVGNFSELAKKHQSHNWFYQSNLICPNLSKGLYVFKKNNVAIKYNDSYDIEEWIKIQRFPQFGKITNGNLHLLFQTRKLLAITVLEEYQQVNRFASSKHEEFHALMEAIATTYENPNKFIFGWTSELSTINSIAVKTIRPPNLIVLNSTSLQYYMPEEDLWPQNILKFLDDIKNESPNLVAQGGDGYWYRIKRLLYDTITALITMYYGNPVLTLLLFGLPLALLSVIIYTSCFADILDAKEEEEEEEEEEQHEKRD